MDFRHIIDLVEAIQLLETREAPLYHGCSIIAAVKILTGNAINANTEQRLDVHNREKWTKGVSLTRQLDLAKGFGRVVLELDQAKLRRHHRVSPTDYWGLSPEAEARGGRRQSINVEAEEFVSGPVKNVSALLRAIHVSQADYDRLKKTNPSFVETDARVLFDDPRVVFY